MPTHETIDTLIIAVISSQDFIPVKNHLNFHQYFFTHISSSGGFLQSSSDLLLIGINYKRLEHLNSLLYDHCKKRITNIATQTQIETHFQPTQPIIIEAETGGATLLTFPVERFEQF